MSEMLEIEVCQDPLSHVNKHIMLRNGLFEFQDISNEMCYCGHPESEHLINLEGIADCCMFGMCICDKFVEKGSRIIEKRLPKREIEVLTTGELNSYIHNLSR